MEKDELLKKIEELSVFTNHYWGTKNDSRRVKCSNNAIDVLRKLVDGSAEDKEVLQTQYAWCGCGDNLTCYDIKDSSGTIVTNFYYCLGCDDYYVLNKLDRRLVKFLIGEKNEFKK